MNLSLEAGRNDLRLSLLYLEKNHKYDELERFVSESDTQALTDVLVHRIHIPGEGAALWNAILTGFGGAESANTIKRLFHIVAATLEQLNAVEVPQKQCFDIIIRLFATLCRFDTAQLIELAEFCVDSLRLGDPKCIAWKDLLPELIKLLLRHEQLLVNGVPMSGGEYRQQCVRHICTMRWHGTVLTPIAMMFQDMPLAKDERTQVLHKVCESLDLLQPAELPPLAYQLFRMCNSAALVLLVVHGFSRYFQKHYYAHLFADMDSDQTDYDSIEPYSAKEMQEAQETILYHLGKATEFRCSERDVVQFCRPMAAAPRLMLSPFFLCAMLSVASINRYPESTLLSSSALMPFLRLLIRNGAAEGQMCSRSAWARGTSVRAGAELSKILDVLVEQSLDGKEIVTPGIVCLAFALLKSGSATAAEESVTTTTADLHRLAIGFLEKFVKKRFIFGAGIVKNVVDFALADLEAVQFGDCLTRLSLTNTYTVSECLVQLQRVLDYALLIPGAHAMRLMSFVIPLCKQSQHIRDLFVEMLRKAMYQRDVGTRQMGIYGFCLVLKHLRENQAQVTTQPRRNGRGILSAIGGSAATQRSAHHLVFSQPSISGYSLMSQSLLMVENEGGNPQQRHFNMLALEIIGALRRCFNQTYEVKAVMYTGLQRAIDFNAKLAPHVVEFLEWHFHKFFEDDEQSEEDGDGGAFVFRLEEVLRDLDGTITVWDHLGHLMQLMGHCVYVCRRKGNERDVRAVAARLERLLRRMGELNADQAVGLTGTGVMDTRVQHLGGQLLNCLEALMGYALWRQTPEEASGLEVVLRLFKQHQDVLELLKASNIAKKEKRPKKNKNASATTSQQSEPPRKPIVFEAVNIWELATVERFLRLVFNDSVPFASATATAPLCQHHNFGRYILAVTVAQMRALPAVAEARHIKHSQSTFAQLGQIARVVWTQCVHRMPEMCARFDVIGAQLSGEALLQCLRVAEQLYAKRMAFFLQTMTSEPSSTSLAHNCGLLLAVLQELLDKCLRNEMLDTGADNNNSNSTDGAALLEPALLGCIELLLRHLPADEPYAMSAYTWLFDTCSKYDVDRHNIAGIHRVLFAQRMRTNTGSFFDSIARQIEQLLLLSVDDPEPSMREAAGALDFRLKSLNLSTLSSCLTHLCAALRQQIEDVEYFVGKAKSLLATLRIVGPAASESYVHDMCTVEQKCSAQLILIAQAARPLCTVGLPGGACSDAVVRTLLDFYACCASFTKHLHVRHAAGIPVVYSAIRFDRLVRIAGRPLATRVYELIEHIENGVFADERYTANSAADRAKVLRATRQLPRLVQRIEMLNKCVLALGKRTKVDLSGLLHAGMVRDFRIRGSAMREVLAERRAANEVPDGDEHDDEAAADGDSEEEDDGVGEAIDSDENEDGGDPNAASETDATATPSLGSATTSTGRLRERDETDARHPEAALQNMAIINARCKRRRVTVDGQDGENRSDNPMPKKKRGKRIPPVKNKPTRLQPPEKETATGARRSTRNRSNSTLD